MGRGAEQADVLGPALPNGALCFVLGVAIKIPIVCVVLEGGPGTLHVSAGRWVGTLGACSHPEHSTCSWAGVLLRGQGPLPEAEVTLGPGSRLTVLVSPRALRGE